MEKVRDGFIRGCVQFEGAISMMPPERRAAARRELNMYRAETLHFRSCADLVRFVQARNRGDRPAMAAIACRELEAAKQLLVLVRGDSRFGYESSNHYFYVPQDLREKILSCHAAIKAAREGMSPGGM